MRNINKLLYLCIGTLSLSIFTNCSNKSLYHDLKKLTTYMHTIVYDDYASDDNHETTKPKDSLPSEIGCATIRNGNYFARNLDYYYSHIPIFSIKVNANPSKHRFASIGTALHDALLEEDIINIEDNNDLHAHALEILPNRTVDGINENGVAICVNSCAVEDSGVITGTNPGKENLYAFFVCRYVLDHATSASHAVELLKNMNIYFNEDDAYNVHYMISDNKNETYIVELFKNELKYKKEENEDQILTNFFRTLSDEEIEGTYEEGYEGEKKYHNYAHGIERFDKLKESYSSTNTIEGMYDALYSIRYSTVYPSKVDTPEEPIYPSEDYNRIQFNNKDYPDWKNIYETTRMVFDNQRRDIGRESDVWITACSPLYDFNDKKVRLMVQEDNSCYFEINFDDFSSKQVDLSPISDKI